MGVLSPNYALTSYPQHSLQRAIIVSPCLFRAYIASRKASLSGRRQATMAVGQHAVCTGASIPLSTWTRPQAGESRAKME